MYPSDFRWPPFPDTPNILSAAFDNNILLYCLPPKTTHKLQLLDISIFGPLQSTWARHTQQCAAKCNSIICNTVVHEYMHIHSKYITFKSITSAFHCSGMWLIDPGIFNEQDFAPSLHPLTHVSGQPSYPSHVPSSPFSGRVPLNGNVEQFRSTKRPLKQNCSMHTCREENLKRFRQPLSERERRNTS